jgi:hypothetical protein
MIAAESRAGCLARGVRRAVAGWLLVALAPSAAAQNLPAECVRGADGKIVNVRFCVESLDRALQRSFEVFDRQMGGRGNAGGGQGSGVGQGSGDAQNGVFADIDAVADGQSADADAARDESGDGQEIAVAEAPEAPAPSAERRRTRNRPEGPGRGDSPNNLPSTEGPGDLGDADDDLIARQLREAAEAEVDPEIQAKLWEEYRKYKAAL